MTTQEVSELRSNLERLQTGIRMIEPLRHVSHARDELSRLVSSSLSLLDEASNCPAPAQVHYATLAQAASVPAQSAASDTAQPVLVLYKLKFWELKRTTADPALVSSDGRVTTSARNETMFTLTTNRLERTVDVLHKLDEIYAMPVKGVNLKAIEARTIDLWNAQMRADGSPQEEERTAQVHEFLGEVKASILQHVQACVDEVLIFLTEQAPA